MKDINAMIQRPPAHNGLVGGSSPSGPTSNSESSDNDLSGGNFSLVGVESASTQRLPQRNESPLDPRLLREHLDYDPITGLFTWKMRGRKRRVGAIAGCIDKEGYIVLVVCGHRIYGHRAAWAHFYGRWPDGILDHINRVRSNNPIASLREATLSQNQANSDIAANNKSGSTGVVWHKRDKRWQAQITANGKLHYLGQFVLKPDAEAAYEAAALLHFGEFALQARAALSARSLEVE